MDLSSRATELNVVDVASHNLWPSRLSSATNAPPDGPADDITPTTALLATGGAPEYPEPAATLHRALPVATSVAVTVISGACWEGAPGGGGPEEPDVTE